MAKEYVTYYDKYGNKRSFPRPDNWEDRDKEAEKKKQEDQLPTNPRDIVKYYFNKGEFEKAENTIKEYGLEDEEEEFIDSLNDKQRSDYMDYLSKNSWEEVDSKSVQDNDGFTTDYTLYKKGDGTYRAVFGDKDLYKPDTDSDMDFANEKEAREWFKTYDGFKEENEKELNELKKSPKTSSQDDIDNSYFNNYKKDQERLDKAREKMSKPIEKKEDTFEYYEHDMNLAKQAYKSSMGDKKEFLRKMRQDYNWDNEDAKKYYDKVNNDRENALSGVPNANNDKYKEYYKKENLGEPSNYKAMDDYQIYYKNGVPANDHFMKISETKDKLTFEDLYWTNKDDKYLILDKNTNKITYKKDGREYGTAELRNKKQNVGKTIAEANKAYKDNKPIIDSNKGKEYVVYDEKQMKWVPSSSLKKSNNGPKTSSQISSKFSNRLIPEGSNYLYDPEILPKAEREYKNSKGDRKQFIERMSDELDQQDARIYFNKFKQIDQLEKKANKNFEDKPYYNNKTRRMLNGEYKSVQQIQKEKQQKNERLENIVARQYYKDYLASLKDKSKSKMSFKEYFDNIFKKRK